MNNQNAEYVRWWRWRQRRRCTHPIQRCVHGDEIIAAGYKRARCLVCGKWLDKLPEVCSWTLRPHNGSPECPPDCDVPSRLYDPTSESGWFTHTHIGRNPSGDES